MLPLILTSSKQSEFSQSENSVAIPQELRKNSLVVLRFFASLQNRVFNILGN